MKKVLIFFFVFLTALCPLALISFSAAGDFMIEEGVLLSYTGNDKTINIPSDVYYIADGAFKDNTEITKVVLNSNLKILGNEAFYGCSSLKSVAGGEGITSVGAYAFYGTPFFHNNKNKIITLNSVVIGGKAEGELVLDDSIGMIAPYAFADNTMITSLKASGLNEIGEGAFYRCSELKTVSVGEKVSHIGALAFYGTDFTGKAEEDFVVLGDGILVHFGGEEKSVVIPDGVKQISGGTFYFNTDITDVSVPEGVVSIGQRAFMNCTKLTSVKLPKSLMVLDKESFARCKVLKTVVIPENVELIGESVFYGCKSLENSEIKSACKIPKGMFANCSELKYVKVSNDITSIGESAFLNCSALIDVAIPDSVEYISEGAFSGADSLIVSCNEGSYTYSFCIENDINVTKCGDANLDGKINIRDATYIQKHTASIVNMSETEALRADVNFDGKINVKDATYIQKMLAGLV